MVLEELGIFMWCGSLDGKGVLGRICCSVTQLCPMLCNLKDCSMPGFPVFHYLPEFAQTLVHWVDDAIQPSHSLLPPSPPVLNLSQHWFFFQWAPLGIRSSKYWSFSLSISPCNEYSGLISFRIDWLYLLAVHGTLKSLHHHSSKASILQCSIFLMVQLSHPYMTTEYSSHIWINHKNHSFYYKDLCQQSNVSAF